MYKSDYSYLRWYRLLSVVSLLCLTYSTASAQPALSDVDCFLYQLQNLDLDAMAATNYDLVVMDYSQDGGASGEFTTAQIAALKASNKIVLAYLSIGEAENYRYYWQPGWVPNNPDWLGPENPDWAGNYKVRYWMQGWRDILFGTNVGPNKSYLDRILQQGFDGIYLDIIDAYYFWGPDGPMPENPNSASAMVNLVADLANYARVTYGMPNFYIFPQNGESLWDDAPPNMAQLYLNTLNGMGAEDVFYFGNDPENNPYNPQAYEMGLLDDLVSEGKVVLSIEYLTQPTPIDQFYPLAQGHGYIPFATVRALDQLTINQGHEPPPNTGILPESQPVQSDIQVNVYPNPGNPAVKISYYLPRSAEVSLQIYDISGRLQATLLRGWQNTGTHTASWNPSGTSGVYFVKVDCGAESQVARALILK